MNSKVVIAPERFGKSLRSSFAVLSRQFVPGCASCARPGDLRTVMTIATVPVEQPGTVVDELWDQRSNGGDAVCRTRAVRVRSF